MSKTTLSPLYILGNNLQELLLCKYHNYVCVHLSFSLYQYVYVYMYVCV